MYPLPKLDCLILHIEGKSITEYFIDYVLKFLGYPVSWNELVCACQSKTIDGQRWEISAKNLTVFRFCFYSIGQITLVKFDSFRTPFWLNEKRWFVACTQLYCYSYP